MGAETGEQLDHSLPGEPTVEGHGDRRAVLLEELEQRRDLGAEFGDEFGDARRLHAGGSQALEQAALGVDRTLSRTGGEAGAPDPRAIDDQVARTLGATDDLLGKGGVRSERRASRLAIEPGRERLFGVHPFDRRDQMGAHQVEHRTAHESVVDTGDLDEIPHEALGLRRACPQSERKRSDIESGGTSFIEHPLESFGIGRAGVRPGPGARAWWQRVGDDATTDGAKGCAAAQHESVAGARDHRRVEDQARRARLTRRHWTTGGDHTDAGVGGAKMEPEPTTGTDRGRVRQECNVGAEHATGRPLIALAHQHGVVRDLGAIDSHQRNGHARPRGDPCLRFAVRFEAAHACDAIGGQHPNDVIAFDRAAPRGARDDGARTGDREDPIHRHPPGLVGGAGGHGTRGSADRGAQRIEPESGDRRHGDDRRERQRRAFKRRTHLFIGECEQLGIDEIGLGERDDAVTHTEKAQDREVLARLRHHALVGSDHEQCEVDAGRAGEHGADESLVAGHVDHADRPESLQAKRCEPERDRDAAALLLREPVGVDAGERPHKCGLAVVDMSRRPEDHRTAVSHASQARIALPSARCSSTNSRNSRW